MIRDNIGKVRDCIFSVCSKNKLDPEGIVIVAVSKNRAVEEIEEAISAGISDIGENRVQEAVAKYNAIHSRQYAAKMIKWHMIGHLQTNKTKEAVRIFDLIHSVDSLRLAFEIDKQAGVVGKIQDVLVQVNISLEPAKFGFKPQDTIEAVKKMTGFKNINMKGLMAVPAIVDNPEKARPYFRLLRELKDEINRLPIAAPGLSVLSMGMTDDFSVAIEEGANMLRLGRVIFGAGNLKSEAREIAQ